MADNPYLPPTTESRDWSGDGGIAPDDLWSAFRTAVAVHLSLFTLSILMLDSGRSNQLCLIAMIGYWLAVSFILVRRQETPTKLDFVFIRYGLIPLWFGSPYIATAVYYFIGESTARGLDRLLGGG